MGEPSNAGKAGALMGGAALVAAAIALAQKRAVKAAEPSGILTLDQETMQLLIAMAQASADIETLVQRILEGLGGLGQPGSLNLQVVGYAPNVDTGISTRVQIAALNTPYRLPDIPIPDDYFLQVKGWPTNGGLIYVGWSAPGCLNINQVWPLLANEAIGYKVKNANAIYISGTVVNDWCALTVEQKARP